MEDEIEQNEEERDPQVVAAEEEAARAKAELEEIKSKQREDTKNQNMAELRRAKEEAEDKAKQAEESAEQARKEAADKLAERDRKDMLKTLVGEDEEIQGRVLEEYNVLNMPDGTPEEMKARLEKAVKLASPEVQVPKMGFDAISSSGGAATPSTEKEELDPEMMRIGGITPDRAKQLKGDVQAMRERRQRNG